MTAPLGRTSLVVLPGHPDRTTWWRNLDPHAEVRVLDEGSWNMARARLLRSGTLDFSVARSAYVARWPRVRVAAGPLVVLDLRRGPADLDRRSRPGRDLVRRRRCLTPLISELSRF
jgi:hypothetical protein